MLAAISLVRMFEHGGPRLELEDVRKAIADVIRALWQVLRPPASLEQEDAKVATLCSLGVALGGPARLGLMPFSAARLLFIPNKIARSQSLPLVCDITDDGKPVQPAGEMLRRHSFGIESCDVMKSRAVKVKCKARSFRHRLGAFFGCSGKHVAHDGINWALIACLRVSDLLFMLHSDRASSCSFYCSSSC